MTLDDPAPTDAPVADSEHEHDWRRNPFVTYQLGATLSEEIVCADPTCATRWLRPQAASPLAVSSWPKA